MIKAPSLTTPNLMAAIRKGLFYASNGPEIEEITIADEIVTARTSECRSITFVGPDWGSSESFTPLDGSLISCADYQRRDTEKYLRNAAK